MESLAGAALILLGILIALFGSAKPAQDDGMVTRLLTFPGWLDVLVRWLIGLVCAWFGAQLLLGHAHYF